MNSQPWPKHAKPIIRALSRMVRGRIDYILVDRIGKAARRRSALGQCTRDPDGAFCVYVLAGCDFSTTADTLIHETAHALTWRQADHGPAWGKAYAKCYRRVLRLL